jgi:hypothetical protein
MLESDFVLFDAFGISGCFESDGASLHMVSCFLFPERGSVSLMILMSALQQKLDVVSLVITSTDREIEERCGEGIEQKARASSLRVSEYR